MQMLLLILAVTIPICFVQYLFIRWTDGIKGPKAHKNDQYIDDSFKMNFIEKKVEDVQNKKL